ncbi:1-phosphatidylinositol-3-phosphate 5-kinase FAB1B-like isoform X2 [Olea europaea var. sylvestris]|uniref:1-phosphatidylinositol-3-phosphate 5-kinase n=1 Tax=Olea europaea subsp. europaea TaxID=158383 RepID=A0A8S0RTZ7_OLEEU|nr:1-phosphatidylinositol-3-phosphate 5-kinase FAB1B-like isoform X2 [Olea europaea var. sylvestris]CAA2982474.1 1-phosphatidylinositol-3-phosphate 5-kinase FAB1B [Olea europaea subsp. europaea]
MDASDGTFSDIVGLLKSWIPGRSKPVNVSRDFWMPDQSCRVCYECDSQFTLFNRRHHCRLCGRVFCARCTSNWIPTSPSDSKTPREDCDKIRVCNFCFKQWEHGLTETVDNGIHVATMDLSITSPSATSFISTGSSGTFDSSNVTFASLPQSTGLSPRQSAAVMEKTTENQSVAAASSNENPVDTIDRDQSPEQFEFCTNRSDGYEEEFGVYQLDSERRHFSQVNDYYGPVEFDDIENDYESRKVDPAGVVDSESMSITLLQNSSESQASKEVQQIAEKEVEHDIDDEFEGASLCTTKDDAEHMDFENSGDFWLPPEPEDEEDEREQLLCDDEDDEDPTGEWGYFRNSSSFGSGEYRSRDKSNEEHKKAMKNVVDGHFRALVSQLLQVENLLSGGDNDKESWLDIITSLSWEAATLLKPDTSKGGQMDPGGYVKVKRLASGRRSDSMVVKGVVCKKNVAHRRMTSKIEKPRLLILGGALEYQRVSNALSSFDTLLQQEMDHLKMAVAKIDVHNPDILLVEKSVSRYAQEYLLAKDISLVLNIKRPLLERIARCTGGQIVPSIDSLSSLKLGYCDMFHVERFSEEHGTAGQGGKKLVKTLMYFEGCPKPLGCTILLRGASGDELKKVKHVVQYGVFAAYHLALETSFLADEGASLPEFPLNSPITVALPDKSSAIHRSISMIPGFAVPANENSLGPQTVGEPQRSKSVPDSDLVKFSSVSTHEIQIVQTNNLLPPVMSSQHTKPLVASFVQGIQNPSFTEPSSFHASGKEFVVDLRKTSGGETSEADSILDAKKDHHVADNLGDSNINNMQNDCDTNPSSNPSALQLDGKHILEEQAMLKDEFPPSPSDHQSILVSLSSRCVWKGTVCERSHLFRIKYYGNFDKPLGRFLRDHLFDESSRCRSCEMPSEAHVQCFTHRQGTLTISVKRVSEILLPGKTEGKIWMWHRCLRCPRSNGFPPATRRVIMSDAAWGLSFGKFLELSFSNHAAASRVASCGHSLHRDCLRFYGFGQMIACFRYASIDVHSVYLPPPKLDFNYEGREWMQNELHKVAGRAKLLFSEVLNALSILAEKKSGFGSLNIGMKLPESRRQITDLEGILQKEKAEFEETLQKILNREAKKGQPIIDIFEINRLQRQLVFQSYVWDHRLIYAASLNEKDEQDDLDVSNSEPIEKSIGVNESIFDTIIPIKRGSPDSVPADANPGKNHDQGLSNRYNSHPEVVHRRIDVGIDSNYGYVNPSTLPIGTKSFDELDLLESNVAVRRTLSDGQFPICLSDTLDAAWTGENHPGVGVPMNNNLPELFEAHSSNTAGVAEELDVEDHGDNLSVSKVSQLPFILPTKGSDIMEDTVSWLGVSFISIYKSLNIFLGTDQKLDTLREYNPVYISSFRESEFQGGAKLLLPVGVNDTVVPVYDDEPTSIISYALVSPAYLVQLSDELERPKDTADSMFSFVDDGPTGKVKYTVTCYSAKRFEALRRICCPSEMDFVRSLSRCKKWGAQGGKSNVFFAKTLDDRFIIKQVTKTELESFIKFAPGYFKYLSESIGSGSPTCLAKILGIYQVTSKHLKGGKESKMDVLVMENLLFGRNLTRLYDLKGSSRSRYNPDSSGSNKVLLDQNLIEAMPTSPIFVGNKAKRLLERAVWNDTAFLASIDVMDYSLLVGVDEEKQELVVGIIDFMRQYTWDKHLETWVKTTGILGGLKNASPTVVSPKQYKKRFRKAMTTYFLMVPDQWSPPTIIPSKSQTDLCEESAEGVTSTE